MGPSTRPAAVAVGAGAGGNRVARARSATITARHDRARRAGALRRATTAGSLEPAADVCMGGMERGRSASRFPTRWAVPSCHIALQATSEGLGAVVIDVAGGACALPDLMTPGDPFVQVRGLGADRRRVAV